MSFYEVAFCNGEKGLDVAELTKEIKLIQKTLNETVIGQEKAVSMVTGGLFSAVVNSAVEERRDKPLATFVFTGPSGVGKTYLAENFARAIGVPYKRFDMSAYAGKDAHVEFSGSDKVYKESKAGNVTSFVHRNPRSVLIFDEIEKAHPVVINLFLQILDNGVLRDSQTDMEVSFSETIIIFTSNAGKQLYSTSETSNLSLIPRKTVMKALAKDENPITGQPYFPASICSRFASGNVIMFNHLDAYSLYRITRMQVKKCSERLKRIVELTVDESVYNAFLFSEGGSADARVLTAKISDFFTEEIFELFRLMSPEDIGALETVRLCTRLEGCEGEVRAFFEKKHMGPLFLFASKETMEKFRKALPHVTLEWSDSLDKAEDMIRRGSYSAVLTDLDFGVREGGELLNVEDVDSDARDLMWFMRVNLPHMPLYLISQGRSIKEEERASLQAKGVRDIIELGDLGESIRAISDRIHCTEGMNALARANKLLSYETLQSISRDKRTATVTLFDFELETALDPEDKDSVLSVMSQPNVTFEDVCGAEEAKRELCYFSSYLKNYSSYNRRGADAPRGILLYGPSGTGKTMLAKAMAKETGATFISADANSFIKDSAGMGIRRVHEIFATARRYAPSIIFVDEFDAIAKERMGARDGIEETLTAFLTEMDGFSTDRTRPVFVLAATNFSVTPGTPKSIDSAVLRRFDRRIYVGLPDSESRCEFIEKRILEKGELYHLSESCIKNTVLRSVGMSLAELGSVLDMALRLSVESGRDTVDDATLNRALESFDMGEKTPLDEAQLHRVARHEAGHVIVNFAGGSMPVYVSVVSRGGCGGFTQYSDSDGKVIYTKEELLQRIRTLMGGRAAELICYGEEMGLSTGASDDLRSAFEIANGMISELGMYESAENIDKILRTSLEEAKSLIRDRQELFDNLTKELIAKNCLCADEIEEILK